MKQSLWTLIVGAAAWAAMLFGTSAASGQTIVPGGPVAGMWTSAGSPYIVQGTIEVLQLAIGPGVRVQVDGPFTIDISGDFTVQGGPSPGQEVVFTSHAPDGWWKGFRFAIGSTTVATLDRCVIERSDSGAIRIASGAAPKLTHCTIRNNRKTGSGGAIEASVTTGDFLLEDCTITANEATAHGGGMRAAMAAGTTLRLTRCRVDHNKANPANAGGHFVGGGLYLSGSATLERCTFDENECYGSCGNFCFSASTGSDVYCDGASTLTARGCAFLRGRVHTTFGFGSDGYSRGSIYVNGDSSLTLDACVLSCNRATGTNPNGCGLWVEAGTAAVTNCTIVNNQHHGLVRNGGSLDVVNSVLFYNYRTGDNPPAWSDQYAGTVTFAWSDVGQPGSQVPPGTGNTNEPPGVSASNFLSNPVVPGDCTACQVELPPTSVCKDTGDPAVSDACFPPSEGGSRSDMGAHGGPYACAWVPPDCFPDCNCDGALTAADFGCFQTFFVLGGSYADCNSDGTRSVADFGCFQTKFVLGCP